jgi:uncharacterized protein
MPLETTPLRPLDIAETGLSPEKTQTIRDTISGDPGVGDLVSRIVLFGSRAKGTWREGSDIDLAVIGAGVPRSAGWRWSDELEERLFPWSVDCIVIDDHSDEDLVAHIERVGIALYDAVG